ncbi:hypothetical protein Cpap_0439 [Ruminiclostridium papyrosolvens DSM 2782]|uniref:Uncharacterized protein n=1 Tax=Ruminiclostridium papyrosolvens DSM 2782 TaxID=588581 RepID=F1THE2_9FIRM|nr:hypothetical protein [Ruminiclostridium papyrosolvens]EGD46145.1 hypothetical protein Cpap_0439 [Ruminiclostridium papyrosolvens DSM 2782]WES35930.1 hypothetical protein P0092_08195 [Ruminiclostridium papyrosolvens DSM 2782]
MKLKFNLGPQLIHFKCDKFMPKDFKMHCGEHVQVQQFMLLLTYNLGLLNVLYLEDLLQRTPTQEQIVRWSSFTSDSIWIAEGIVCGNYNKAGDILLMLMHSFGPITLDEDISLNLLKEAMFYYCLSGVGSAVKKEN